MPAKRSLDDLQLPKDEAPALTPIAPAGQGGEAGKGHTLSLRLDSGKYQALRRFVMALEAETGKRVTHQTVIETALDEYMARARK